MASRVHKNSLFAFLSAVTRLLANVLLFLGIARYYGAEEFGQFTVAHTIATLFIVFADFGFDTLLITEVSRARTEAGAVAEKLLSYKLLFVLTASAGMLVIPFLLPVSGATKLYISLLSLFVAFSSLINFFSALFKGLEQFHYDTQVSLVNNAVLVGGLVVLGILGAPLWMAAILFVAARGFGLLMSVRIASRLTSLHLKRPDFTGWRESVKEISVFGIHFLFGNLFFMLDTILLLMWRGDHAVGIYQSVFKLIALALLLPDVIMNTLMPVLSRLHHEGAERWQSLGHLMNKTLLLLGLPIALVLFVYAEQVIALVYGLKEFGEAVPLLRIFAIVLFVRYSVETPALMLTTSRRQHVRMTIVISAVAFNYLVNSYMIPRLGTTGAALASLGTNIFVGAGYILAAWPVFRQWKIDLRSLLTVGLILLVGALIWNYRALSIWYGVPILGAGSLSRVLLCRLLKRRTFRRVCRVAPLATRVNHLTNQPVTISRMPLLSIICCLICLGIVASAIRRDADALSPARVFGFMWALAIGLTELKLSGLQHTWTIGSWIRLLIGVSSFMLGILIGYVFNIGRPLLPLVTIRRTWTKDIDERRLFISIALMFTLYIIAYLVITFIKGVRPPLFSAKPWIARREFTMFALGLFLHNVVVVAYFTVVYFLVAQSQKLKKVHDCRNDGRLSHNVLLPASTAPDHDGGASVRGTHLLYNVPFEKIDGRCVSDCGLPVLSPRLNSPGRSVVHLVPLYRVAYEVLDFLCHIHRALYVRRDEPRKLHPVC